MRNYKKLATIFILIQFLNCSFFSKESNKEVINKKNKITNQNKLIIVDTVIKEQKFKVCYDSLRNKIEIDYLGLKTDFKPLESFDIKKTINSEVFLLTKSKESKYYDSKFIIVDDNKILIPLIDEFLSFGLYIINKIDGKLEVSNINLDNKNTSYTELAYFDLTDKSIIVTDKLSMIGENNLVTKYNLSENKPKLITQKIIKWAKFKKEIKESEDEYIYYKIIDKILKKKPTGSRL